MDHPASREWIALAQLIDVLVAVNTAKGTPKEYPRPWKKGNTSKSGKTTLSSEEARKLLAKLAGREYHGG